MTTPYRSPDATLIAACVATYCEYGVIMMG
jgi:hypothetical protein